MNLEQLRHYPLWNEMIIHPDIRVGMDEFTFDFSSNRLLSDEEIQQMERTARQCLLETEVSA